MTRLSVPNQAPGFYRRRVGAMVVTAINDGVLDLPLEILNGIAPEQASALLTARFRRPTPRISANAFIVQGGGQTMLIDTGAGAGMGPGCGRLLPNLAAAGIQPGAIDLVLMTHLHPDHCGGLATAEGAAVFPNAALGLAAAEADFWLNDAAANAPEPMRPYVLAAQAAVAPYRDRIRLLTTDAAPGITRMALPGHTPGHSGYRIGDGADALLIWGDIMQVPDVQSVRPDVGVGFDVDGAQAQRSRMMALDMAATDRLLVAGMHLHFPAFSHVSRNGQGFDLIPEPWMPEV
jgi:glyoxylase-like metal-dependent hydrolase (beta-lactamase superfamily II)